MKLLAPLYQKELTQQWILLGNYMKWKPSEVFYSRRPKKTETVKINSCFRKIKGWLDQQKEEVLPKSPLGGAIQYTLKLWKASTIYTEYGFYKSTIIAQKEV